MSHHPVRRVQHASLVLLEGDVAKDRAERALACAVAGELRAAESALGSPGELVVEEPTTRDLVALTRTLLLLDHGHLDRASRAIEGRPPASYDARAGIALWVHAQVLLHAGRAEEGVCLLEQTAADGLLDERSAITRATRAELDVALGDLRSAAAAVEPDSSRSSWSAVAEATVLYVSGEFESVRYAARVARSAHELTLRESVRLRGLEAAACIATGDDDSAARLLAAVLGTAREQGWAAVASSLPRPVVAFGRLRDLMPADTAEPACWIPGPALAAPLSPRERAVLRLLLDGADRAGVADRLGVSLNTVKTHLRSLYAKLGVTSRGEVLRKVALMPAAWTYGVPDHPEV
jgi:LuxR family maltose regulon positive regulatory protein